MLIECETFQCGKFKAKKNGFEFGHVRNISCALHRNQNIITTKNIIIVIKTKFTYIV